MIAISSMRARLIDSAEQAAAFMPAIDPPMRSASSSTMFERLCLIVMLSIFVAVPFLSGGQLTGISSLDPLSYLEQFSSQGDPIKQAIFLNFYAVCGVLLVLRSRLRMLLFLGTPLLLLTAWCFVSVVWSVNPDVTVRRDIALLGTVTLGAYMGLRFDLKDVLRLMSYTAGIVLIGSVILAVVAPPLGLDFEGRLRGVFEHKNALGSFAALSLLVLVARLFETNRSRLTAIGDGLLAVLSVMCMAVAHSTAVILVLMIGLPLLLIGRWIRTANGGVLALIPVAISIAVLAAAAAAQNSGAIAEMLDKESNISGRTLVWDFATRMILEHPWVGYGFGAFWVGFDSPGAVFWATQHLGVPHAHNGYLQLALDVGGVGLGLFLIAVITVVIKLAWLLRNENEPLLAWAAAFLAFDLVTNLSETRLWLGNELLPVLFIYVVVRTNIAMRKNAVLHRIGLSERGPLVEIAGRREPPT